MKRNTHPQCMYLSMQAECVSVYFTFKYEETGFSETSKNCCEQGMIVEGIYDLEGIQSITNVEMKNAEE